MKNIKMSIFPDKILTIQIDLSQEYGQSASGKSVIIASTEGNQPLDGEYDNVRIGINVYKKADRAASSAIDGRHTY